MCLRRNIKSTQKGAFYLINLIFVNKRRKKLWYNICCDSLRYLFVYDSFEENALHSLQINLYMEENSHDNESNIITIKRK